MCKLSSSLHQCMFSVHKHPDTEKHIRNTFTKRLDTVVYVSWRCSRSKNQWSELNTVMMWACSSGGARGIRSSNHRREESPSPCADRKSDTFPQIGSFQVYTGVGFRNGWTGFSNGQTDLQLYEYVLWGAALWSVSNL